MYDLRSFGLSDLARLSSTLRTMKGASMEEAAQAIVDHLFDHLIDKNTGEPSCVLARLYKTHRLGDLEPDVQDYARARLAGQPSVDPNDVRCLTLLATAGVEEAWRDRRRSVDHRAVPLPTLAAVQAAPMIHGLLNELGVDVRDIVSAGLASAPQRQPFEVFHVPVAAGSPLVPAQSFVAQYGVRSVLGFGGLLPGGELYAAILFSRTPIAAEVADHFKPVAMSTTLALVPLATRVFPKDIGNPLPQDLAGWTGIGLEQLLEVRERAVLQQSLRLEQALTDLEDRAEELARSREAIVASEARKSAVLESALDAVITMDTAGQIVEFNPAAEAMFRVRKADAIGVQVADLVVPARLRQHHLEGLARYLSTGVPRILGERIEITAVRPPAEEFPVELTVNRVQLEGAPMFTAFIRDISAAKRREAELRDLARTLQESLLPPRKPTIPGLDVDTSYRPASGSLEVGGDFFDVFRIDERSWGVVIGDVCGKGARAASLTALARYAVRSTALHVDDPAAALSEVNTVILGDEGLDERFCTAAYARVQVHDAGASVRLATAGHPNPAVLRANGTVEWVGEPAWPLGMFEHLATSTAQVDLAPGDAIVLFTDGVVEAHEPRGALYGEHRLETALIQAVGRSAAEITGAILRGVADHVAEPSDDIAIVVLRVPVGDRPG